MNSFPPELVEQHYPCMHVAGLGVASSSKGGPNPAQDTSTTDKSHALPEQVFPALAADLRSAFSARGGARAWDPTTLGGNSTVFHTVFVDEKVSLPPRRVRPLLTDSKREPLPEAAQAAVTQLPSRSLLSPLHVNSPLFPNGIISPLWLRRHIEQVPSVHVVFYCLSQLPAEIVAQQLPQREGHTPSPVPSELIVDGEDEVTRLQNLKKRDEVLITRIAESRRILTERGIKLTVVLLTTRDMLSHPSLEARLSYIRRSSELDSKASLFVLTQVSAQEVQEFVASLQAALHESAQDYYREHSRRVRRKRARYPPPLSTWQPIATAAKAAGILGANIEPVPLSREEWHVRAEIKLAVFSELAGDLDTAMQHYSEAYDTLCSNRCLGSTSSLPPRTKRWAEAKVLVDTVSIRISRLHLYHAVQSTIASGTYSQDAPLPPQANQSIANAMNQFHRHIKRFTELSTGWGIGDATFEFWSWLGKQYRMFGDLFSHAFKGSDDNLIPMLKVTPHSPPLPTNLLPASIATGPNPPVSLGLLYAPSTSALAEACVPLQRAPSHPGYIYYLAALCTIERRARYRKMIQNGADTDEQASGYLAMMHEKKVDHLSQMIEVLTQAHRSFEGHRQARHARAIALQIAQYQYEAERYDDAIQLLRNVIKQHRAKPQEEFFKQLYLLLFQCAEKVKDVANQIKALCALSTTAVDTQPISRTLSALLQSEPEQSVVIPPSNHGIVSFSATFSTESAAIGTACSFQIVVRSSVGPDLSPFKKAKIFFNDKDTPSFELDAGSDSAGQLSKVGQKITKEIVRSTACLLPTARFSEVVWEGSLLATELGTMRISRVDFETSTPTNLILQAVPTGVNPASAKHQPLWLTQSGDFIPLLHRNEPTHQLTVLSPNHKVKIDADVPSLAYLQDPIETTLKISNEEAHALEHTLLINTSASPGEFILVVSLDDKTAQPDERGAFVLGALGPGQSKAVGISLTFIGKAANHQLGFAVCTHETGGDNGVFATTTVSYDIRAEPLLLTAAHIMDRFWNENGFLQSSIRIELTFLNSKEPVKITRCSFKPGTPSANILCLTGKDLLVGSEWKYEDRAELFCQVLTDGNVSSDEPPTIEAEFVWVSASAPTDSSQQFLSSMIVEGMLQDPPQFYASQIQPSSAKLGQTLPVHFHVRNTSRSKAVSILLTANGDTTLATGGSRIRSLPALLPGTHRHLPMRALPLAEGQLGFPSATATASQLLDVEQEGSEVQAIPVPLSIPRSAFDDADGRPTAVASVMSELQ